MPVTATVLTATYGFCSFSCAITGLERLRDRTMEEGRRAFAEEWPEERWPELV